MFIYNFKLTKTNIFKIILVVACVLFLIFFGIATYKIVSSSFDSEVKVNDNILKGDVAELTIHNYTNVLKIVHNNLDTYLGQKIKFSGYVYRAPDFAENEFVLARNMIISNQNHTLIVGFLCNCNEIKSYEDNTWIEIVGEITKGNYHGETPVIKISQINKITKPEDEFVYPPDDTYIPTSVIL